MSIQELTRQMIIDELLMIGCVAGHMHQLINMLI